MMGFVHNDRQGFAFQIGSLRCLPHLARMDGMGGTIYKGITKLAKHRSVEIDPVKSA